MKLDIAIASLKTVTYFDDYWTEADYRAMLEACEYAEAATAEAGEVLELAQLALTDLEPAEAAGILLTLKLGERMTPGQIEQVSHEMQDDKVAEDYADPALHYDLFNVNQFLYRTFNGGFPNTEASVLEVQVLPKGQDHPTVDKELLVKALAQGLRDSNLINRLYADQVSGEAPFTDAAKAIWKIDELGNDTYRVLTSKYWIDEEDIGAHAYEAVVVM